VIVQQEILDVANAMVSNGMLAAGYTRLNLDVSERCDCMNWSDHTSINRKHLQPHASGIAVPRYARLLCVAAGLLGLHPC
jgi:hypothetical protein